MVSSLEDVASVSEVAEVVSEVVCSEVVSGMEGSTLFDGEEEQAERKAKLSKSK